MKRFFFFDEMIAPRIITFIYWVMLLFVVLMSLIVMIAPTPGMGPMPTGMRIGKIAIGFLSLVGGALFARVWCEVLIVVFKIYENVKKIAEAKAR